MPATPSLDVIPEPDSLLYGCAYYHEYMPAERLARDVAMMKEIGFTVMRVGESTWSLWEPEDGRFEYGWIERVVDALHAADIKVIIGTPTYALPPWLAQKHPEIRTTNERGTLDPYGMRQSINVAHPTFRRYAERVIRAAVTRFAGHPGVIGWQVDNEPCGFSWSEDVEASFRERLKKKFPDAAALNEAWGLSFWGQTLTRIDDLWPRIGTISPSHKLEWTRHHQSLVEDYVNWHAALIRELKAPRQFVTTNLRDQNLANLRVQNVEGGLDVVGFDTYHEVQDDFDGHLQAYHADIARSLKGRSFLLLETRGQTTAWGDSRGLKPGYDGQLRLNAYCNVAGGADSVMYWPWHSVRAGFEMYCKGMLTHDLEFNRTTREAARVAAEFRRVGPRLVGQTHSHDVAILHSTDSHHGLEVMPFLPGGRGWLDLERDLHRALFELNIGADFVFPETPDFSRWKVLVVPSLYIADDGLLDRLVAFVRGGGHLVLGPKSGFCNEHHTVRPMRAPGPLREIGGVSYQEFASLPTPIPLKDPAFGSAGSGFVATDWFEFLEPEGAEVLARLDHPFYGRWAAITHHRLEAGSVLYMGTVLAGDGLRALTRLALERAGLTLPYADLPAGVRVRTSRNRAGRALTWFLNCGGSTHVVPYRGPAGHELLKNLAVPAGETLRLEPWDVAVVESADG